MEIFIGTSGWVYPPWRNTFYPPDLPHKKELLFASRHLTSLEINASFYSYQKPETYQKWYDETPDSFVFSVKGPQYITHILRLKEPEFPLANFFASGLLFLRQKLGAILWQLPPSFVFNEEKSHRLEHFLSCLPRTRNEALALSSKSQRFAPDYPEDIAKDASPLRHALEVRHHSFESPFFIDLLRKYKIALVFADTAGKWPYMEDLTADFIYLRLHGDDSFYPDGYNPENLKFWNRRILCWAEGTEPDQCQSLVPGAKLTIPKKAFIYFDNDDKILAPQNAQDLIRMIDQ